MDISNYNKLERMCSGSQFQFSIPLIEEMMAKGIVLKIIIYFYPNFLFWKISGLHKSLLKVQLVIVKFCCICLISLRFIIFPRTIENKLQTSWSLPTNILGYFS